MIEGSQFGSRKSKDFSPLHVAQNVSEAYTVYHSISTVLSFLRDKVTGA
jgi:hypothetical protein